MRSIREAYSQTGLYNAKNICARLKRDSVEYTDRLTARKLELVIKHHRPGLTLDLCCATGGHLFDLLDCIDTGIGIDFSVPFISKATSDAATIEGRRLHFAVGDATCLPLASSSTTNIYSFSALYLFNDINLILDEIVRVLAPGGVAILDFSNAKSLNAFCVSYYTEYPPTFFVDISLVKRLLAARGLKIVERRAFQILPLWADRPGWLWPLLHPVWKRILGARIGGRMLDEWISNLPVLRAFAFRHIIVCEKPLGKK